MKVTLVRITEDPVMAIEEAASVCYDSEPSPNGRIMNDCYESRHHSVLEFVQFHFLIEDVSRALLAQLTRHRMAGYAVRSQRYVNESNSSAVAPPTIVDNEKAYELYADMIVKISECYDELIDMGIPAEDARYILPNGCCTKLHMTMNLRSLINFMNERLCKRAQEEIRSLANCIKDIVLENYSQIAEFLVPKCEIRKDYPFCTEKKSCGRHPRLKDVYRPEKHGWWEEIEDFDGESHWRCSVCKEEWWFEVGGPVENRIKYCPHCGAKLDLEENHHEQTT